MQRILVLCLLLAGPLGNFSFTETDCVAKLSELKAAYAEYLPRFSAPEEATIHAYLELEAAICEGAGDRALIAAYDKVYRLAAYEETLSSRSPLFHLFGVNTSGFPLVIAQIARDSESLTKVEKVDIVTRQLARSKDPRIRIIRIDQHKTYESYQSAIDCTLEEIHWSNPSTESTFRHKLMELRYLYQMEQMSQAYQDQGGECAPPRIPHNQTLLALKELRIWLSRDPDAASLYIRNLPHYFEEDSRLILEFYRSLHQQFTKGEPPNKLVISELEKAIARMTMEEHR